MVTLIDKTIDTRLGQVSYGETGSGPPVVILHSLLTDRSSFDAVLAGLPGRVAVLDLPGFGTTDQAEPDLIDYAGHMAAAVEVVGDGAPVTLVGNGLGAFVALALATERPDLVGKLILVGCGVGFPEAAKGAFVNMAAAVQDGGMAAVVPTALRRIFTEDYLATHEEEAAARTNVLLRTDPAAFVSACRGLERLDLTDRVGSVTAPTLIVVGEEDAATPPALAADLQGRILGSQMVVLPGLAHAPQIQDPGAFLRAIVPFMEVA